MLNWFFAIFFAAAVLVIAAAANINVVAVNINVVAVVMLVILVLFLVAAAVIVDAIVDVVVPIAVAAAIFVNRFWPLERVEIDTKTKLLNILEVGSSFLARNYKLFCQYLYKLRW